ncbi:MAG TPA: glycosyltransferase family 2 protein [Chloroflexia bacterium]|nr:glycosyltransferase family 2 protein [Chloroflexia bacterium]
MPEVLRQSQPVTAEKTLSGLQSSVVIVSYNSRADLEPCLESLLQTTGSDCEIIVVDNASTDGSAELIREKFPRVRLIANPANSGFAAANNLAVSQARGRYIVALNPDTRVTPGWLEALLAPFEQEAGVAPAALRVGLTTPRILMLREPEKVNTCGNSSHFSGLTVCRGLNLPAGAAELQHQAEVPAVSGACFAIRRDLWQSLGGLDETFFTYLEDTDLSLRARLAGYTCLYQPDAVVYHDYANHFSARKIFYLERNRYLLLLKTYRARTLLCLLPALLLVELITWGYALKNSLPGIKARWQAYLWILTHPCVVRRKRREAQALRRVSDRALLNSLLWKLDISQLAGARLAILANYTINPFFRAVYALSLKLA